MRLVLRFPAVPDDAEIPTTPEALIEAARKLRFEAGVLAAQAGGKLHQAEAFEALAGARAAVAESRLTIAHKADTIDSQMEAESAGARRSLAQIDPRHEGHKFVAMLKRRKISVGDVALFLERKLKRTVPRSTVTAWYKDPGDPYYRVIPEDAAMALKDEYAVPISAWPSVRQPKKG